MMDAFETYWACRFRFVHNPANFGKDGFVLIVVHFTIQISNMKVISWMSTTIGRTQVVLNDKAKHRPYER